MLPIVVAIGALWSVLPLPIWLVGSASQEFFDLWLLWLLGVGITVGATAVVLILSDRRVGGWLLALWRRGVAAWPSPVFLAAVASVFAVLALLFTLFVLSGNPHNVDGFAQLFQARIFLAGRLWMPPPAELAHFATLHMVLGPERWFAQYPPGQSVVLASGLAMGAWWVLNLVFSALLVLGTYYLANWTAGKTVARLSAILLCLSPFAIAIAGTEMNHLPAAAIGVWAIVLATASGGTRATLAALGSGLLLGAMIAFRPLDAVATAVPVALVVAVAAKKRIASFALVSAGGILGTLPTLWFNAQTTGRWSEFGYTHLWGPLHSLGFHDVPFGVALTPARAVGLTGLDLHQLNRYLFDLPFPILLLIGAGYVVGRRMLRERDALPVVAVASLVGLLFFYWHRDVFYGPRFLFSAVPWIVIMAARAIHLLRHTGEADATWGKGLLGLTAIVVAMAVGTVLSTPSRISTYRDATSIFKLHPNRDAAQTGIHNAVVVIPDGWGTRLIGRMWQAGISVQRSTTLYAAIDACTLHRAFDEADVNAAKKARIRSTLDSLAALGRRGSPTDLTADPNLRLPTWEPLSAECVDEIAFDQRGFLAFAPYLYLNNATLDGDVVWARDMRAGNAALASRYPDRSFYRYSVQDGEPRLSEFDPTVSRRP